MAAISSGTVSVPESGPSWLVPADRMLKKELAGLVATHWGELPQREQKILLMDFRGGMTQAQIGQRLCISQMHVSRLRTHALGHLRSRLLDLEGAHANAGPALALQPPTGHAAAASAHRLCGGRRAWSCVSCAIS